MKIFKFAPAEFQRMYFVAPDLAAAMSMRDVVYEKWFADIRAEYVWDAEGIAEAREESFLKFDEGFDKLEEHDLAFIDTNY